MTNPFCFSGSMETYVQKNHLLSLTWLRAFAAFFVVVSHTVRASEQKYAPVDEESYFLPFAILDLGTFGVYLFFALSGCTLYISNKNKVQSLSMFGAFFLKRFFRIWPPFAVSILIYLIFIEFFKIFYSADSSLWIGQFLQDYTFFNVFQYLSLTFNITGPSGLFQDPYWSLPVEFQYYLLFPIAVILMKRKGWSSLIPILFGAALYLIYSESLLVIDKDEVFKMGYTFFGGILLAYIYQYRKFQIPAIGSIICFFGLVFLVGLIRIDRIEIPSNVPFLSSKWNVYGISAIISVFLALNMKPIQKENVITGLLTSYGEVSYSIYLFHMIFIGISVLLVVNAPIYGDTVKLSFIFLVTLLGSYFFSILSYKFVEMPSIKMGRKLSKALQSTDTRIDKSVS